MLIKALVKNSSFILSPLKFKNLTSSITTDLLVFIVSMKSDENLMQMHYCTY